MRLRVAFFGMALVPGLPAPALAVDGVREINQDCAVSTGCVAGDTGGFPVSIGAAGSYRLTSDLAVPAGADGIRIEANDVSLDLNGFTVASGGSGAQRNGIFVIDSRNTEIRNGTVRGFTGRGVYIQQGTGEDSSGGRVIDVRALDNTVNGIDTDGKGSLVRGCTAIGNGFWGISVVENSVILESVAYANTREGLLLSSQSGYGSNVLGENNGGSANPQVSGGLQIGTNVCGFNTTCP
jgi:hypothetical protein